VKSNQKRQILNQLKTVKVFGTELKDLLLAEGRETCIPILVEKTVHFLDEHADEEGLFRVSPSAARLTELATMYSDIDSLVNLNLPEVEDNPHVVAGLLKKFLRELPDPMLTYELYTCFIAISKLQDDEIRLQKYKTIMQMLPDFNKGLVDYILDFIDRIADHSEANRMTISNMATVFGPILLRSDEKVDDMLISETVVVCDITMELVEHREFLFDF